MIIFKSMKTIIFSESGFESMCSLGELHITELSCLVSVACGMWINICSRIRTSFFFCKVGQKAKVVPVHLVTYMVVVDVWRNSLCYKVSPASENLELLCGQRDLDIQAGENSFKAFVLSVVGFVCFKWKLFGIELGNCKCHSVFSLVFQILPLKFYILNTIDKWYFT